MDISRGENWDDYNDDNEENNDDDYYGHMDNEGTLCS